VICRLSRFDSKWDNIHSHRNLELNKILMFVLLPAVEEVIGSENTLKVLLGKVIFTVLFVIFILLFFVLKEKVKSNIKLIAICAPPALLYLFHRWVADRISLFDKRSCSNQKIASYCDSRLVTKIVYNIVCNVLIITLRVRSPIN
jgi:hypothetical protein